MKKQLYKIGIISNSTFADNYTVLETIKKIHSEYENRDDIVLKFNILTNGLTSINVYIKQQLLKYYNEDSITLIDDDWIIDILRTRFNNLIPRGYFFNNNALMYKERDKLFFNACDRFILFAPTFSSPQYQQWIESLVKYCDTINRRIHSYNDKIIKEHQLLISKGINRKQKKLKNEKYINIFYDI